MENKVSPIISVEEYNALPISKFGYKTRVRITDEKGNLEVDSHNATMLMGRLSALEYAFKPAINRAQHYTLNTNLSIHPAGEGAADTDQHWYNRKVAYFGVGTGGINAMNPLTLTDPMNYETILYNHVPIRLVPIGADLSDIERANYRLRKQVNISGTDYFAYYLKTFDPGTVFMVKSNGVNYLPVVGDSDPIQPGSEDQHPLYNTSILTYQKFQLFISGDDFKEYYRAMNGGSLVDAKLSELAICMGNDIPANADGVDYTELVNTELFGKIVHSPTYMDQEENAKTVTYEVFT